MDIDEPSGRVVVCGHRLMNGKLLEDKVDYWMNGACYWSHINDTLSERLVPLQNKDMGLKRVEQKGNKQTYLFYYAQGQAGFSAHFSASKDKPELLLGAPGVWNWDGTALILSDGADAPIASKLTSLRSRRQLGYAATGFGEFNEINIANAGLTSQTASFGLFGYAVTSGYFFNKNELLYASGGPRSKTCIGQILLFKFSEKNDQALDVKDIKLGDQHGEYFGAALTAGDINQDGYDDLIVGAPFYTNQRYSEGRIFIFLGSPKKKTLEVPKQNPNIEGNAIGGQFGSCLMYLGDLHGDGYAAVAVAAPYENEGSGVLYIYRGNSLGLESKHCQKIEGRNFVPNIKGFGISISRPTDIDGNFYKDLAIGAYLSGHAVLLRSRPVVTLKHRLVALIPQLEHNAKSFEIIACSQYEGSNIEPPINIRRKIIVDDLFRRAYLPKQTPTVQNITLNNNDPFCQNITIHIDPSISNRNDPVTVSISQELASKQIPPQTLFVIENIPNQQDKFCSTCPVSNTYKSTDQQTIELPFALGCGDDNICQSSLDLQARFLNVGVADRYVLGSTDYVQLEATISNSGEKAYSTGVIVKLPNSIYFRSIPTNCLEGNSSSEVLCSIENPLDENKQKSIVLDVDMKEVSSEKYGDTLNFTLTVLTTSENLNKKNVYFKVLNIVREADIGLTGKTSQQSYSYGNITNGKPNFTQIYQVEKFGASPIEEVSLTIEIPTQIYGSELINFVQLYPPEGYHAGQPINCQSNVNYLIDEDYDGFSQFNLKDVEEDDANTFLNNERTTTEATPSKRSVRETTDTQSNKTNEFEEYPLNRTLYINCSNSDVECSYVNCAIGPFKTKQNMAVLQLRMLLNAPALSELLGVKDIIIFSTTGIVTIKSPSNFTQSGDRLDIARVSSVFIGEKSNFKIETWHIIVAVVVGILLLLLLTMGLVKAGFFQRKKREQLQALKEAEVSILFTFL
ncbi:hypothetical protein ILUMI_02128 [Ignelater luminosus]|uniref:Uncharacterized protein n=1 Tax=Ignelater luminosus TaxID=2038154 RepID=A0A8K0DGZ3_IGNLU|nr:hypothetical protein ILUMI_02128 [Ignelater luminosus]